MPPTVAERADQGPASTCFSDPTSASARTAVRARTGSDPSRSTPSTSTSWKPGEPLRIDSRSDGFPVPLDELEPGRYAIQAVVRLNPDTHRIGDGEGNAYGPVVHAELDPETGRDRRARRSIKLVDAPDVPVDRADQAGRADQPEALGVSPPADQASRGGDPAGGTARRQRQTKLPTLYIIPGFGGDHFMAARFAEQSAAGVRQGLHPGGARSRLRHGPPCLRRQRDQRPRGTALVEEFIPHIEQTFPALADPRARLARTAIPPAAGAASGSR